MYVYVITATYRLGGDVPPITAVAYTKEAAVETVKAYVDLYCREPDVSSDIEDWIVRDPDLHHVEGEPKAVTPPWRTDVFTDAEREEIIDAQLEEMRDCLKDYAAEECDKLDLVDCIVIVDPGVSETTEFLIKLRDGQHLDVAGETYEPIRQFCKRFGLIDESELPVTPRGHEYIERS